MAGVDPFLVMEWLDGEIWRNAHIDGPNARSPKQNGDDPFAFIETVVPWAAFAESVTGA